MGGLSVTGWTTSISRPQVPANQESFPHVAILFAPAVHETAGAVGQLTFPMFRGKRLGATLAHLDWWAGVIRAPAEAAETRLPTDSRRLVRTGIRYASGIHERPLVSRRLPSRFVPHRHRPRAELQPASSRHASIAPRTTSAQQTLGRHCGEQRVGTSRGGPLASTEKNGDKSRGFVSLIVVPYSGLKRYPTPTSVTRCRGFAGFSSSFWRSWRMKIRR